MRLTLGGILADEGYEVFEAQDLGGAIALLPSCQPELVLLDMVLPDCPPQLAISRLQRAMDEAVRFSEDGIEVRGFRQNRISAGCACALDFVRLRF